MRESWLHLEYPVRYGNRLAAFFQTAQRVQFLQLRQPLQLLASQALPLARTMPAAVPVPRARRQRGFFSLTSRRPRHCVRRADKTRSRPSLGRRTRRPRRRSPRFCSADSSSWAALAPANGSAGVSRGDHCAPSNESSSKFTLQNPASRSELVTLHRPRSLRSTNTQNTDGRFCRCSGSEITSSDRLRRSIRCPLHRLHTFRHVAQQKCLAPIVPTLSPAELQAYTFPSSRSALVIAAAAVVLGRRNRLFHGIDRIAGSAGASDVDDLGQQQRKDAGFTRAAFSRRTPPGIGTAPRSPIAIVVGQSWFRSDSPAGLHCFAIPSSRSRKGAGVADRSLACIIRTLATPRF